MIAKKFRLTEIEVKKVLKWRKPFFSYWIVANQAPNKLSYNRFALVVSSKSIASAVERNFFRRIFYEAVREEIFRQSKKQFYDFVFVIKKQNKLDKKDKKNINLYKREIRFLFSKIFLKK